MFKSADEARVSLKKRGESLGTGVAPSPFPTGFSIRPLEHPIVHLLTKALKREVQGGLKAIGKFKRLFIFRGEESHPSLP